jgi:hypothetical protein
VIFDPIEEIGKAGSNHIGGVFGATEHREPPDCGTSCLWTVVPKQSVELGVVLECIICSFS